LSWLPLELSYIYAELTGEVHCFVAWRVRMTDRRCKQGRTASCFRSAAFIIGQDDASDERIPSGKVDFACQSCRRRRGLPAFKRA
jgi:hypothetical protein